MLKRRLVSKLLDWTDGWDREIHDAIERRVFAEFHNTFPNGAADSEKTIADMRSFYYVRMTNTAMILIAAIAFFVSITSLLVSAIALAH